MTSEEQKQFIEKIQSKNIKLFVGTPAYQGNVHVSYSIALSEMRMMLKGLGIDCVMSIPTEGALLCASRNGLLKRFIDSDCTHMLCIDSDLGWSHQSVLDMLYFDLPFMCGLYPARDGKNYIYRAKGVEVEKDGQKVKKLESHPEFNHLFKAECVPAGFMLLKREMVEKMMKDHEGQKYTSKDTGQTEYALFNTEVIDGQFWGEDYVFCRKAQESGFDIWVHPFIKFCHAGVMGCFAENILGFKPKE